MMGIYDYLVDIYKCQYRRHGSHKRALASLSDEGQLILAKSQFDPTSIPVYKETTEWKLYFKDVWRITNQVRFSISGIENRGFTRDHIDHIVSIWDGFRLGIPAEKIGGINNLRMLPHKINMKKGRKSHHGDIKKLHEQGS